MENKGENSSAEINFLLLTNKYYIWHSGLILHCATVHNIKADWVIDR